VRPGSGPTECGQGIKKGAKLSFKIIGTQSNNTEYEILQYLVSQFSTVGVKLKVKLVTSSGLVSDAAGCSGSAKHCGYDMELWITGQWPWGWPTNVPIGTENFYCGATSNYLALCNAKNDTLITDATTSAHPAAAIEAWENFMARQQFEIYLPVPAYRVVAYKSNLHGVTPLTPYLYIYPTEWYFTK
jgi:peptide/nickel transport system substrate-binding protein